MGIDLDQHFWMRMGANLSHRNCKKGERYVEHVI